MHSQCVFRRRRRTRPIIIFTGQSSAHRNQPPFVSHPVNNDNLSKSPNVPIKATALGIGNILLTTTFFLSAVYWFDVKQYAIYFVIIMGHMSSVFHLPLILILTVKSNPKKAVIQPSHQQQQHSNINLSRLHFHEESLVTVST